MEAVLPENESPEVVFADRACTVVAEESDRNVGYGVWGGKFTCLIYLTEFRNWIPAAIYMCSSIFDPKVVANAPSAVALQAA